MLEGFFAEILKKYFPGPSERNSNWGGGAEARCEQNEEKQVLGGLPPGKFFMTTPFKLLENDPFLDSVPWGSFYENFEIFDLYDIKDTAFLIDSGSFLEYIRVWIFIPMIVAFTALFTYKINELKKLQTKQTSKQLTTRINMIKTQ